MNTASASIRHFVRRDLAAALKIQTQVYPVSLVESEAAFASRLDAAHTYCLVTTVKEQLAGYLLAYGWHRNSPPELGSVISGTGPSEILFIHDLAVATAGQGLGSGRRLVDHAFDLAVHDGLKSAELVAVEGAAGFWKTMGFVTLDATPEIAAKLAGYGRGATWMGRTIG